MPATTEISATIMYGMPYGYGVQGTGYGVPYDQWCTGTQPLPGGYRVGEKVFYTGANQTTSNGDKVVHGQQGEVVGPATADTHKGMGVAVRFPCNKGNVQCYLYQARLLCIAPTATPASASHTRSCPHPVRSRDSLCPEPKPSLHGQPLAPQPTA